MNKNQVMIILINSKTCMSHFIIYIYKKGQRDLNESDEEMKTKKNRIVEFIRKKAITFVKID